LYTLSRSPTGFVRVVLAAVALGCVTACVACSFLIDKNAIQCVSDADCHVGFYSSCQRGVCVDPSAVGGSGAGACMSPTGCFRCTPEAGTDFLNACTDAGCVSFDNAARLTNLADDGKLKPLP
jgi:hypothetical protein